MYVTLATCRVPSLLKDLCTSFTSNFLPLSSLCQLTVWFIGKRFAFFSYFFFHNIKKKFPWRFFPLQLPTLYALQPAKLAKTQQVAHMVCMSVWERSPDVDKMLVVKWSQHLVHKCAKIYPQSGQTCFCRLNALAVLIQSLHLLKPGKNNYIVSVPITLSVVVKLQTYLLIWDCLVKLLLPWYLQ